MYVYKNYAPLIWQFVLLKKFERLPKFLQLKKD